jgi:hypothetical protein
MREHPKRDWLDVQRRQWSKPEVEEVALTDDVLQLFRSKYPTARTLDRLTNSPSTSQT